MKFEKIQQILDQAKKDVEHLTPHQIALQVSNSSRKYDSNFQSSMTKLNAKKGLQVEVKAPGKSWKRFDSISKASEYYNWPTLKCLTKKCFPHDGSIKHWNSTYTNKRHAKFNGYQTRRVLDVTVEEDDGYCD